MSLPQLLADRNAYHERLRQILPASITGTTAAGPARVDDRKQRDQAGQGEQDLQG